MTTPYGARPRRIKGEQTAKNRQDVERRDRLSEACDELKRILLFAMPQNQSKFEKADIMEQTVLYIGNLRQNMQLLKTQSSEDAYAMAVSKGMQMACAKICAFAQNNCDDPAEAITKISLKLQTMQMSLLYSLYEKGVRPQLTSGTSPAFSQSAAQQTLQEMASCTRSTTPTSPDSGVELTPPEGNRRTAKERIRRRRITDAIFKMRDILGTSTFEKLEQVEILRRTVEYIKRAQSIEKMYSRGLKEGFSSAMKSARLIISNIIPEDKFDELSKDMSTYSPADCSPTVMKFNKTTDEKPSARPNSSSTPECSTTPPPTQNSPTKKVVRKIWNPFFD